MFKLKIADESNPANNWVAFDYHLALKDTEGTITISDTSGNIIEQFSISGKQGQYIWDTRVIKSGVYFYTLISNGLSKSGKIIINYFKFRLLKLLVQS